MNQTTQTIILFIAVFFLFGIVFFSKGLSSLAGIKRKRANCTEKTVGTIVGLIERKSTNNSRPNCFPVIEYTVGETTYKNEYSSGGSRDKYNKGHQVEVRYNPSNAEDYYITGDNIPKTASTIAAVLGVVFMVISAIAAAFTFLTKNIAAAIESLSAVTIVSGILVLLGIIFFIVGTAMLRNRNNLKKACTARTAGKVLDTVAAAQIDGKVSRPRNALRTKSVKYSAKSVNWRPVIEYTVDGLRYEKEYPYSTSYKKYTPEQDVEICYDPDNASRYYIAGDALPKASAIIFTAAGLLMLALGAAAMVLYSMNII